MPDCARCHTARNAEERANGGRTPGAQAAVCPCRRWRALWHFAQSGIRAVWHLAPFDIWRRLAFRALAALRRSGPAPFGARTYGAQATTVADAAREKDVVIVTIPEKAVPDLRDELGGALDAKTVVVDTGNYYPKRDGRITEIESGIPESKWVADQLGRPVVKASTRSTPTICSSAANRRADMDAERAKRALAEARKSEPERVGRHPERSAA
jgi:hypothetical protein